MRPFESDVSSKYGAPMGRRSNLASELRGKVHLCRVPGRGGGDYDLGGAYWGAVEGRLEWGCWDGSRWEILPVWCAWDDVGSVVYLRASSREEAKASLRSPGMSFYR